jgi:hypothetical protein
MYRLLPPEARHPKRRGLSDGDREMLEDVQRKLGAAEHVEARLAEVEERLDFAERLLAQQRTEERLAGPPD